VALLIFYASFPVKGGDRITDVSLTGDRLISNLPSRDPLHSWLMHPRIAHARPLAYSEVQSSLVRTTGHFGKRRKPMHAVAITMSQSPTGAVTLLVIQILLTVQMDVERWLISVVSAWRWQLLSVLHVTDRQIRSFGRQAPSI
jgi:hypothetical protein